jgi:hypothetical protein
VENIMTLLLMLLAWHALADYPLQGDFLAKAKNRFAPIPGVPWQQALGAHALIHAAGVAVLTGSVWLGLVEFVAHSMIDDAKCRGRINFNQDQALHALCKLVYVGVILSCAP